MARVSGNGGSEVKSQNELVLALKQGNVVTCGVTSRRHREGGNQRRDVMGNVAT